MPHPYCTAAAVEAELPHFTGEWGTGALPDEPGIVAKIEENDQLIDGKLARRFEVPFPDVPERIARISRDLTVCDILDRVIRARGEDPAAVTASTRKRLGQELTDIANGTDALDPQGVAESATVTQANRAPMATWDTDPPDPAFPRNYQW